MARAIDADRLKQAIDHDYYEHYTKYHDSDQTALIDMVMDDIDEMPTLTPPNEALTLGLVDKYGAPLYAGDTVAADKFFMYAIRYGSHNVNPKQCEPAYQVGWYLEIVWALYNEDKTYIGHTEALYDIGGVAARYPAHCADTTEEYKTCCCISTARRRYRHETAIHPRRAGIHHPGDRNIH